MPLPTTSTLHTTFVVVDVNAAGTPPTVRVVVIAVPFAAELMCRTHTVWLLLIVPAPFVNMTPQPTEYEPLVTLIGVGLLIPVIVTTFDVIGLFTATPICDAKLNASGVVSTAMAPQDAVEPAFAPTQLQVHGPVPVTVVGVPTEHRLLVGTAANTPPLAVPHAPLTGAATVDDTNAPDTPPTFSVVVTDVLLEPELVCRTHTVWLLTIVPGTLVKVAVQPIE